MRVLVIYLLFLIVGQAFSVGVGLLIDPYSKTAAIAVFIPTYYAMYWVAWRLALYIVERSPDAAPDSTGGSGGSGAATAVWLFAPAAVALEICD